jgi:uncharacterized protein (DUF2267 family)
VHQYEDAYDDAWRYERFITTIQQRAGISWEQAERAAHATLRTLGERIAWGEARDLGDDLPQELRAWLLEDAEGDAEPFDADQFAERVAEREGVDPGTAAEHARAVFVALARLVRGDEIEDLVAELPKDYERLVGEAVRRRRDPTAPEPMPIDEFLRRVADRAGTDRAGAEAATEAVLETLAERIAGGEVDDIADVLPEELRAPLHRGRERSGGKAQRMSLDEFVERIAEREGVDHDAALEHARAVIATLREALPPKELSDLLAQLPRGYQEALLKIYEPAR